jgi:microcystin-dependent protein
MSEPFLGEIKMFGGNFAPRGFAFCEGQLLQISQNSALFSLLGTIYGGDGRTTFGLPDLRGRSPIHFGQGPGLPDYRIGEKAGAPTTTLAVGNLPSHNHPLNVRDDDPSVGSPTGAYSANAPIFSTESPNAQMGPSAIGNTGGGTPFNNMQPFLAISFIIALVGVFPSRS